MLGFTIVAVIAELLAGTADGIALLIQKTTNLTDQDHVMALIVTTVSTSFNRA